MFCSAPAIPFQTSPRRERLDSCWIPQGTRYSALIADIPLLMYPLSRSFCSHMASSLLSTAMTIYLVLAVSVFLYGTFYYAYMPVELANIPVIIWVYWCTCIFQFIRWVLSLSRARVKLRLDALIPQLPWLWEVGRRWSRDRWSLVLE